jgi:hypothetical protein
MWSEQPPWTEQGAPGDGEKRAAPERHGVRLFVARPCATEQPCATRFASRSASVTT